MAKKKVMTPAQLKKWRRKHMLRINKMGVQTLRKRVMCVETGEIYESCAEAAKEAGLTAQAIRNAANPNLMHIPTAGGYVWRYIDETE